MLQNCHTHIPVGLLCIQLTAFRCSILLNPLTWEAFRYKFAASDYGTTTRGKNCAFFDCCNHTLSYSTGERKSAAKTSRCSGYRAHPPPPVLLHMGICSERALRFFHLRQPAKEHLHPLGGRFASMFIFPVHLP